MTPSAPCDGWLERLSAYLDSEDPSSQEVERHLRACEACAGWVTQVEADRRWMRSAFAVTPDARFVGDVMDAARRISAAPSVSRQSKPPARRRRRVVESITLAAAACLLIAVTVPVFVAARATAKKEMCLSNLRDISSAASVYAQDNWDTLPPATTWEVSLSPYVPAPSTFLCPETRQRPAYHYPAPLGGQQLVQLRFPTTTLMAYDQADANGTFAPRHGGVGSVAFLDGHASTLPSLPGSLCPPETQSQAPPWARQSLDSESRERDMGAAHSADPSRPTGA